MRARVSLPCAASLIALFALAAASCGNGPTQNQPVRPLLLEAISAGYYTTCGLALTGKAYCWGDGGLGQLGVPPTDSRLEDCSSIPGEAPCASTPTPVSGGGVFTTIAAGGVHFCALLAAGQTECWGDDQFGQLGTLDTAAFCGQPPQPCAGAPVIAFLGGAISVSGGDSHTCAVQQGGTAYCWGYGSSGQLGNGGTSNREVPDSVGGVQFRSIDAGGASTCGIAADSTVYCWGLNHLGQLGDDSVSSSSLPRPIASTERFVQVSVGAAHACGVTSHGAALCWGSDISGELGTTASLATCNGVPCSRVPVPVQGGIAFVAVLAGEDAYTCGLSTTESYCWGEFPGRTGPGSSVPAPFGTLGTAGGEPFVALSGGFDHACGITATHGAYCWGSDYHGKLGDGPGDGSGSRPVIVVAPDSTSAGH